MSECRTCEQDFILQLYEYVEHCVYKGIPMDKIISMLNDTVPKMHEEIKKRYENKKRER